MFLINKRIILSLKIILALFFILFPIPSGKGYYICNGFIYLLNFLVILSNNESVFNLFLIYFIIFILSIILIFFRKRKYVLIGFLLTYFILSMSIGKNTLEDIWYSLSLIVYLILSGTIIYLISKKRMNFK